MHLVTLMDTIHSHLFGQFFYSFFHHHLEWWVTYASWCCDFSFSRLSLGTYGFTTNIPLESNSMSNSTGKSFSDIPSWGRDNCCKLDSQKSKCFETSCLL